MISRPLVLGILAASCITAAAGGAYVAVRQNGGERAVAPAQPASPAVAETEAVIAPPAATPVELAPEPERTEPVAAPAAPPPATRRSARREEPTAAPRPQPRKATPAPVVAREQVPPAPPVAVDPLERTPVGETAAATAPPVEVLDREPLRPADEPAVRPEREMVEVVVPAASVMGLRVETPLSSERARVEDRVEARVTRDVNADGRVAIPAGSRVVGSVTLVERGGKVKERARLGVRFHTLVLADGSEVPIRTESVIREGESPSGESARKIGGAAIGGAILGALIGGGKGAAIGGATGAAGGTAVVMAGDRNAATLPAGTVVSVRLSSPVTLDVERR